MLSNEVVINQVGILFLIMLIGVFARKINIITDQVKKGMTDFVLKITLPLMIISSFNQNISKDMIIGAGSILLYSIVIHFLSFILSKVIYNKVSEDRKSVLSYLTVFSNAGFMGFPLLEAIYGKVGVFYASIYAIPLRVFMWTLGIALFSKEANKSNLKEVLLNPGIIAVFIGFIPFVFSIKFPVMVSQTAEMVGSITTPLSMVLVGTILADIKLKDVFFSEKTAFYGAFIRLIALPLSTLLLLKSFGAEGILLEVSVILTAMPAASFTAILAAKYNANETFATKCVFLSTIFSIVTIPVIVILL